MKNVTLDENHVYKVDGVPAPSVSSILDLYFPPSKFYTEDGRVKGHSRHEWYNFLAQGFKADSEPDDRIAPAIKGFMSFMSDVQPEYISGEIPYYHPTLMYCGKPDVVFKLAGRLAVIDFKPKAKNKRTQAQSALYYSLLRANGIMVQDRYELRLYDGIYRLDKHDDMEDVRRAEIMVEAYHASQFYK